MKLNEDKNVFGNGANRADQPIRYLRHGNQQLGLMMNVPGKILEYIFLLNGVE